jgi:hypothetical protein
VRKVLNITTSKTGANQMDLQVPVIVLLMLANILWFIVGWGKGFSEGKREGLAIGKNSQRVSVNAR